MRFFFSVIEKTGRRKSPRRREGGKKERKGESTNGDHDATSVKKVRKTTLSSLGDSERIK
jgi:hypothetical protein